MFQFPVIETTVPATQEEVMGSKAWEDMFKNSSITIESINPERIHLLTHQRLHIRFFAVKLNGDSHSGHLIAVEHGEISKYPVPKPIENFLFEMGH